MENLEGNGRPASAAAATTISTARTETTDADNSVNATIPGSEPLTIVLSGGEKGKVNDVTNKIPDVTSRGKEKLFAVTARKEEGEEEKLDDVSDKNAYGNRPTMNTATSGDADDAVLVSKGEKAKVKEKLESTVKGREENALVEEGKIDSTPKKAKRKKKRKKKNKTLRDSGDAVANISRNEETVSGAEKKGEEDEMKENVGNTLNKANKRRKLVKSTQGGAGSTVSVVSGGEENVELEKEVVNTPKETKRLKRKKSTSGHSVDANAVISGGKGKMEDEDEGNVENNPKKGNERRRRGSKGRKKNTTLKDADDAVAKDADDAVAKDADQTETLRPGKASVRAESKGMIFMCNSKTKQDCYRYKVLGLPASRKEMVANIYEGMRLFLFDIDRKLLYGIYKAAGPGGYNIEHNAFNSAFPSQVRFTILNDCPPLPMETFKTAIKDNFYEKNKFNCELTSEQVKNLCKLFLATTKSSKPKQDGSAHSDLGRDLFRTGRIDKYERAAYSLQLPPPTLPRASYETEAYVPSSLPSRSSPPLNVYGQPIQTGLYRRDPQKERHHHYLTYSRSRQQGEIEYQDSNVLYRGPTVYHDSLYPAGGLPGYYHPSY